MKKFALLAFTVILASCAQTPSGTPVVYKDGELPLPSDYKNWPKFLSEIQRADAKQIREIFVNPVGNKTVKGESFPNGTRFVMELYAAKAGVDGTLEKTADGKLIKGNLLKVFVMGKDEGFGKTAPEGLKNGDWVYAGYLPTGASSNENYGACRGCHLPLASVDFVFRYDEYFQKRVGLADNTTIAGNLPQDQTKKKADVTWAAKAF
jgi:hemoglobin